VANTKVGIVGIGQMGMPMLERLRSAGLDVAFRARRPELVKAAQTAGAVSTSDFGDRDVVIICVYTDSQVREVADEVLPGMRAGAVLVNHTTGRPATAEWLGDRAASQGVAVLDCALSGSPADVGDGHLTLLIGGDESTLASVRPVLAAYADPILHVGALGDGQRVKLVNNALFGAQVQLAVEAERVARDLGVDPATALGAITRCSGTSRALELAVLFGSAAKLQQGAGRFIRKDMDVVEEVAREIGVELGRLGPAVDAEPVDPQVATGRSPGASP
jgi:3-hydroxyisobutyrate dehydrogenase-like beta-hydroxyacid dehydrogenase